MKNGVDPDQPADLGLYFLGIKFWKYNVMCMVCLLDGPPRNQICLRGFRSGHTKSNLLSYRD